MLIVVIIFANQLPSGDIITQHLIYIDCSKDSNFNCQADECYFLTINNNGNITHYDYEDFCKEEKSASKFDE